MYRKNKNSFDFIRIFAALLVIFSHSYALSASTGPTIGNKTPGEWGVVIFFIVSGFLLTQSSDFSLRYFWKRGLRILPGLFVVTIITVFILGPLITSLSIQEYFNNKETWRYLLSMGIVFFKLPGVFESNPYPNTINGSLWMLPYLFSCYAILYVYGKSGLLNKKCILLILYIMAFGMLFVHSMILPGIKSIIYTNSSVVNTVVVSNISPHVDTSIIPFVYAILSYFASLVLSADFWKFYLYFHGGVVLALFQNGELFNYKSSVLILFIAFISVIAPSLTEYCLFLIVPYFVIYFALTVNSGILNNFGAYGDFSFGMYIYAFPIQQTIAYYLGNNLTILKMQVLSVSITFIFAVMSWKIIESHMLKLKNWKSQRDNDLPRI
jgi:Predicted acyltransferases